MQILVWISIVLMFTLHIKHGRNCYKLADLLNVYGYKTYPKWSISSLYHGSIARAAISSTADDEEVIALGNQLSLINKSRMRWILSIIGVVVLGVLQ
jgi:hypothetical protein